MCSTSVDPSPSTISQTGRGFHPANTSARQHLGGGQRQPQRGEVGRRRGSAFVSDVYSVGRPKKTEGRKRSIAPKIEAGFGRPGSSTVVAPAANGKVIELPNP